MSDSTSLVLADVTAIQVYTDGGMFEIIAQIRAEVFGLVPNLTTAKGRKAIASMAAKVARSKTRIDALGKDLTADIAAQKAVIDIDRREMRDALDELRDEVRRPLTEWEDAEKKRIADIEYEISLFGEIVDCHPATTPDRWREIVLEIEATQIDGRFSEFAADAATAKDSALALARAGLITAEAADRAEAERKAEAKRLQAEREQRLQAEAAASAKREAEEYAARKAEQVKQAAVAERQRVEQERLDAERREHEAKDRAARAEANAQRQADEAAARAKQQAEQAEQARREAEAATARQQADAEAARAADVDHRRTINREAMACILATGLSDAQSIKILTAIIRGEIPHVEIKY